MGILAINVIKLRNWSGITQNQLARSLGVGLTTVNNIETGYLTAPSQQLLEKLAILFGTTKEGLLGNAPLEVNERARLVYVVSSLDAKTTVLDTEKIVDGVFIDRDKLRGFDWFGLKIKDNALSDEGIKEGYTAIVKMNAPLKNNDVVVAAVNGSDEAIVRIYHKKGDIITLKASNSNGLYKNIVIDTRTENVKLIGKVEKCEFEL